MCVRAYMWGELYEYWLEKIRERERKKEEERNRHEGTIHSSNDARESSRNEEGSHVYTGTEW